MLDIAVIFTCYNRQEKTKKCIQGLLKQVYTENIKISFYICDDNSNDNTVNIIKSLAPNAHIAISKGNLYWCKGMHTAMNMARQHQHDFYLMINDDLDFKDNAIQTMIDSYKSVGATCGIVGTTSATKCTTPTYGGRKYLNFRKVGRNKLLSPNGSVQECDIANWNCFLVPESIIKKVGLVDRKYQHGLGDFDYCWAMRKHGFPIYVATDYIGWTDRNSNQNTYMDKNLTKISRLKKLLSIKGRPIKSEWHFYIKNHGFKGIAYFVYIYSKLIIEILKG